MKMIGFKVVVTASLLVIGGSLVLNQSMNIGQFVAAEIIILLVINSVEKLILGLESFYDILTSLEKLGQVVDKELEVQEGETPSYDDGITIELDQISYQVANREKPILKNVSFKLPPKSRVIIKGESGAGKSSLLQLLAGIIKPTSGHIYINNLSISSLFLNHFRSKLGLSLSEESPFEGTIKDNLTFGNNEITDDYIFKILDIVGLSQFIKEQSNGLQTILYPEGKQMSNTIAKKIVLARALIKQPKVLILEDALDQFNEDETNSIIDFITSNDNPWTLIVVGSNKRWISKCTQQITLENGEIKSIKF